MFASDLHGPDDRLARASLADVAETSRIQGQGLNPKRLRHGPRPVLGVRGAQAHKVPE